MLARQFTVSALENEPPIVLADEPTGCLNTETGIEVMELLRTLNGEGLTVLVVTHNPDNTRFVRRTVSMRDGRIYGDRRRPVAQDSERHGEQSPPPVRYFCLARSIRGAT